MSQRTNVVRAHTSEHIEYMDRYYGNPRESDKKISRIIKRLMADANLDPGAASLLDMGSMTGNLILHLMHEFPGMKLTGSDIDEYAVEDCRKRPELDGVEFEVVDILNPGDHQTYDFVVASAAFYGFDEDQYETAVRNIASLLNKGGWFIQFDWIHEFHQSLKITERSNKDESFDMYFRPLSEVRQSLERCGFVNIETEPFVMPFDLRKSSDPETIKSYTVNASNGERLCFRGALFQPWCHLWAQAI